MVTPPLNNNQGGRTVAIKSAVRELEVPFTKFLKRL